MEGEISMDNESYLTPEDFDIAEENGIPRHVAHRRFYEQGHSRKRAVTQPVQKRPNPWAEWKDVALKNGICKGTFKSRIYKGSTPEQAATEPIKTTEELAVLMEKGRIKKRRRISKELHERARKNGISATTLQYRLLYSKHPWSEEDAVTIPPMSPEEVVRRAASFSTFRSGNNAFFKKLH
ncbi:transcription regulator [Bacillus phage vB_BanH_Emiliahah]|nr:transcription regulator [Bacillus phage vB_BanH_Emiliahah]